MPESREAILFTAEETQRLVDQLAERLCRELVQPERGAIVGIRRGGAVVAKLLRQRMQQRLGISLPIGFLDITFYRDDLDRGHRHPVLAATELDFDIDDKKVILVDDIFFTGRTIRAALSALFDYGRPETVQLAVLVDRGHRQLPIHPDFVGVAVETLPSDSIKLRQRGGEGFVLLRHS